MSTKAAAATAELDEAADQDELFYDSESEPSFIEDNSDDERAKSTTAKAPPPTATATSKPVSTTPAAAAVPTATTFYAVQFINNDDLDVVEAEPPKVVDHKPTDHSESMNRIFKNYENAMRVCKKDPDNRRFKVV